MLYTINKYLYKLFLISLYTLSTVILDICILLLFKYLTVSPELNSKQRKHFIISEINCKERWGNLSKKEFVRIEYLLLHEVLIHQKLHWLVL